MMKFSAKFMKFQRPGPSVENYTCLYNLFLCIYYMIFLCFHLLMKYKEWGCWLSNLSDKNSEENFFFKLPD